MSKYIDADELKRAIFFNDYSPLVIDDNVNAVVFQILRLIDSAPALEINKEEALKNAEKQ